jgi:hypothetical protein
MKKILLTILAVLAMGGMAMAQTAPSDVNLHRNEDGTWGFIMPGRNLVMSTETFSTNDTVNGHYLAGVPEGWLILALGDTVPVSNDSLRRTTPITEGTPVTIVPTGNLRRIKSITLVDEAPAGTNLSELTGDYTAQDGEVLTGTLNGNYKITIADGATITLNSVTINGANDYNYPWAGLTCEGDATIILADGSENSVKGFYSTYPGIQAGPTGKTLIIKGESAGTGKLTAISLGAYTKGAGIGGGGDNTCGDIEIQGGDITAKGHVGIGSGCAQSSQTVCGNITISGGNITAKSESETGGAGIGSGWGINSTSQCGDITISGGTVNATGSKKGAGIGCGYNNSNGESTCGNISISGGTVTATAGRNAAGIGGGSGYSDSKKSTCGNITIANTVTEVTATKGEYAPNSIGAGLYGTCGTVTIAGVETGYITASPYTYPLPPVALSAITSDNLGWIVGSDGNAYVSTFVMPSAVTAVAMIAYVDNGHGLAIQLNANPETKQWADGNTSSTPGNERPAKDFAESLTPVPGGTWRLPSMDDWVNMLAGCAKSGDATAPNGGSPNMMQPIAGFKEKIAATGITWKSDTEVYYWTNTPNNNGIHATCVRVDLRENFNIAVFYDYHRANEEYVLGCLAF